MSTAVGRARVGTATRTRTGRALRWHGAGDLRLEHIEVRAPGPGEVLVAVAYCGVCGSDLHEIADGPHAIPTAVPHALSGARAPVVLGHEFSGTVLEVGAGVTHVRPGHAVAVEPNYRCGTCTACREGRYEVCDHSGFAGLMGDGGMAEMAVVPAYMLHVLPDGFDLAAAAVLEPAAVALHALRRAGWSSGDPALVLGLGPIGALLCALMRSGGASLVIGVDPQPARRAWAEGLGTIALDPAEDVAAACREHTGGDGVAVAFEAVGAQRATDTAVSAVRRGGDVVLLGLVPSLSLPAFAMVNAEIGLITSVGYRDCHAELIDLVEQSRLDLAGLVSESVPLAEAAELLTARAAGGAPGLKTLVRCGNGDDA